jgi:Protein of unknown function (DUF4013)
MVTTPAAPVQSRTIDFGRAFSFVPEDPDWIRKILIGGAFTLACAVLVGIPFVLGYSSRTFRNVASGAQRPLPEWDDLGGIFEDGLRLALVYFAHALGLIVVFAVFAAVLLAPMFMATNMPGRTSDALGFAAGLGILLLYALVAVVSLALAIYLPAALARASLSGRAGSAFEWRENLAFIRDNLVNYALALVSYLVASFLSQFGFLLCCVGVFPAAFWSHLVLAAALGQTVRVSPRSY